jgi:citrate lyase beta subunit
LAGVRDRRRALVLPAQRNATLPLRYWGQTAHYATPAADVRIARNALFRGTAPMQRLLTRHAVTGRQLAERLGVDTDLVEDLLAHPRRAALVVIDGEDAIAPRPDAIAMGVRNAVTVLQSTAPDAGESSSLRFYRPPGFDQPDAARHLLGILIDLVSDGQDAYPLDGIVFPKIKHVEEAALLDDILSDAESQLGMPKDRIHVGLLIESAWAVGRLPDVARPLVTRLCSLIFGGADYTADVGLPALGLDHPQVEWARATIVNAAGALGVPAIDGMTLEYPVADAARDSAANRAHFLAGVERVFRDAVRAIERGMTGKWVGHPAQLFAVLLASEVVATLADVERDAARIASYSAAVSDATSGVTVIEGVMSDRATDRHARARLRRAVGTGRFEPDRALALGLIDATELDEARAIYQGRR